jgi:putative addiction module killer protein
LDFCKRSIDDGVASHLPTSPKRRSLSSKLSDDVFTIQIVEVQPREIQRYITPDGRIPFAEWLNSLRDRKAILIIDNRLRRIRLGNFGDCRSVGEGVCELRIDYGSGYRIYFGQIGTTIVLLLYGGDKSTQAQDIRKAQEYWRDYERREDADQ